MNYKRGGKERIFNCNIIIIIYKIVLKSSLKSINLVESIRLLENLIAHKNYFIILERINIYVLLCDL